MLSPNNKMKQRILRDFDNKSKEKIFITPIHAGIFFQNFCSSEQKFTAHLIGSVPLKT